jgi:hypothetical protein
MTILGRFLPAAALAAAFATGTAAQDGPIGIAIAAAPEMGSGVCFADNLDRAFACAREKCAEAVSDYQQDCYRVAWCYPAGWSADLFIQNQDGFHSHDYMCGWNDREALEAAIAIKCDKERYPYLLECDAVQMWDHQGNEVAVD